MDTHMGQGAFRVRGSALGLLGAGAVAAAAWAAGPGPAGAGAAPAAPAAVPAQGALPRVNLAVEWRWSEAAPRRSGASVGPGSAGGSAAAAVVTATTGSIAPSQGQVTLRTGGPAAGSVLPALPSRLVVANGGGARMRLAEAVPLQMVQLWQEPSGTGAAIVAGWAESAQALELRLRWPGGQSAAEVELEVEQAQPAAADGTGTPARRERLATRAWVPLGEWVTVAAWGGAGGGAGGGAAPAAPPSTTVSTTVSTTALEARTTRVLQLRLSAVTAP